MASAEVAPDTEIVRVGPTPIRVRQQGEGPPLLLLMGIGANLDMWQPLLPHLPDRRLVMFDFPGTGGSGPSWLPPTMGCNALLVRMLLRRLGISRTDVLGYSWGGMLAQHLAVQHPRTVRRLVLAATTVGLGGVPPSPEVAARMVTPRRYYSRTYFRDVAPTIYGGRYRSDPDMVAEHAVRRVGRPPSVWGYAMQLAALSGYSTLPGLPFIGAPTLVLAGDDDPIVSSLNPRLIARLVRRSRLEIIPGAGHLLLIDSPDTVGPLIEGFLAGA